ncbi:MAG: Calx-beta domain-containing protein, partial [Desulfonatronovibrio sp.]
GEPPAKESVPIEVNEGQRVYFLVEIPGGASEYSSVDFLTRDGTAQAGLDYIPTSGQITFEPGDTFARVWVQTLADSLIEGNEDFELVLTNPAGAGFPHDAEELTASRIIVDDVSLTGVTELAEDIFGA